ncbi:MAG: hypothetical protein ACTMIB_04960, partial [Cellulosimicrobium funkei]
TDVPGLHLAPGHGRNGILLAPLTADAVVAGLGGLPALGGTEHGDDVATALATARTDRFARTATTPR